MTDDIAKKHLRKLLRAYTPGRILHLLAELSVEEAKSARQNGNDALYQQLTLVEAGLILVGYGLDVARPE
jgi:hypothetical protein